MVRTDNFLIDTFFISMIIHVCHLSTQTQLFLQSSTRPWIILFIKSVITAFHTTTIISINLLKWMLKVLTCTSKTVSRVRRLLLMKLLRMLNYLVLAVDGNQWQWVIKMQSVNEVNTDLWHWWWMREKLSLASNCTGNVTMTTLTATAELMNM